MTVHVIGHRNPDTDAICSAIAYADLLQKTSMPDAKAARCGDIPQRTKFVLDKTGIKAPKLLSDVRPRAKNFCIKKPLTAKVDETFHEVYERMRENDIRSIPVIDEESNLYGMLSLIDLLELLFSEGSDPINARKVEASMADICHVINGEFMNSVDENTDQNLLLHVGAMSASNFIEHIKGFPPDEVMIVAGDRPTIQIAAIEYGVRAIVITGGYEMSSALLQLAKERHISVLISPYDTATTTMLIKSSRCIRSAVEKKFIRISEGSRLREVKEIISTSRQSLFPVVSEKNDDKLIGVISRTDLISPKLNKIILVDHNELSQAIDGAEDANILEVIDHHRLGGSLRSKEPIRFHNEPVGSTCTIIATRFKMYGIDPSPEIATIMASGIISDTLLLNSPTTTDTDRNTLQWLGSFMDIPVDDYAKEFFESASVLKLDNADKAVIGDCKEFEENRWQFTVSQIEELDMDLFWPRKDELLEALEKVRCEKAMDFACMLVTDIIDHNSLLLTAGNKRILELFDDEHEEVEDGIFRLDGVVSRKKQLLPMLAKVFSQLEKMVE